MTSVPDAGARSPVISSGRLVIALDGPAGAGKSTVAARLADMLGLEYLDTGAMYRAVTFAALRDGVQLDDAEAVSALARNSQFDISADRVLVDGDDATAAIRGPEVTAAVSTVAAVPAVRAVLVERQRAWANERNGGVLEGRDIGTVVFPDARLKVFVTASPRVRAERRVAQSGGDVEEVAAAIAARDLKDSAREASPLAEAGDAVHVDTSELSVEQVVAHIMTLLGDPV